MISEQTVRDIVAEKIAADGGFIVEVAVSPANDITLVVDNKAGVPVSYCIELSNLIESALDRDVEDYSLEVSSAGIGCVFKVQGQYEKNIGNEVEVTMPNGAYFKGVLVAADAEGFEVEHEEKERIEGQKKKTVVVKRDRFAYNEVKQVKDIISFKR